jgi:hypothetical protein
MKHILGMAKSFMDLKGAKSQKLELDYLRLVYAVKDLAENGEKAKGYFVVLTPQIEASAKNWEYKYRGQNSVDIISVSLPNSVNKRLKQEKRNNISGMLAGSIGQNVAGRSIANFGKQTGENTLKEKILGLEPRVKQIKDENKFPCCVRWDFYGTVD